MKGNSDTRPNKIQILGNKVLIRTNIVEVTFEDRTSYNYDEVRYTKDEYIELLKTENMQMWDTLSYLLEV